MSRTFSKFVSSHITTGHLILTFPNGSQTIFGDGTGPTVVARIKDQRTLRRLTTNPELAFGEAFMDGTFQMEEGSIYDFLELVFRNTRVEELAGIPGLARKAFGMFNRWTGQGNRFWILIVPKREHSGNEPCVLVALVD